MKELITVTLMLLVAAVPLMPTSVNARALDYVEFEYDQDGDVWVTSSSRYSILVTVTETTRCPYESPIDYVYSFWLEAGGSYFLGPKYTWNEYRTFCSVAYKMRAMY